MKFVIIGYGVQGKKRHKILKNNVVSVVDPYVKNCVSKIEDVPLDTYNAMIICVPDEQKVKFINFAIKNNKHLMIEKPLMLKNLKEFKIIEKKANKEKILIYTCYNHRFEPHLINLKKIIDKNKYGKIYYLNLFYGNGTAKLVKESPWRDKKKSGVIEDLGSHLIDLILYLFNKNILEAKSLNISKLENKSPDYCLFTIKLDNFFINCEVSLCSWKNSFNMDLFSNKGSIHIENLCKWGPSKLITRERKYPSGKPKENIKTLSLSDPTWLKEYKYFKRKIKLKEKTDLSNDYVIQKILKKITNHAI